jgi:AcrR family transcriptional regulator
MFYRNGMRQPVTRRYDASGRREQARATRQKVIAAATELLIQRGWANTSMRDVAKVAGVSVETVYGSVGNKLELLRIAIDTAVVGDDEPVPLSERPAWQRISDGTTARERVEAIGDLLVALHPRSAPLHRALQHAAVGEPDLAELLRKDSADMREQTRQAIASVLDREPTEQELDLVQAVTSNETYLLLTEQRGHSDEDFREFVVTAITRLLGLDQQED